MMHENRQNTHLKSAAGSRRLTGSGDVEQPYLSQGDRFIQERSNLEPPWMTELRKSAMSAFRILGFPHKRIEEWKYSDWRKFMRRDFEFAAAENTQNSLPDQVLSLEGPKIVICDGRYQSDLSTAADLPGLEVTSLLDAHAPDWFGSEFGRLEAMLPKAMAAFDNIFATAVLAIRLGPEWPSDRPLHLINVSTGRNIHRHVRILLVASSGTNATVVEEAVAPDASNAYLGLTAEVFVHDGAELRHYNVAQETGGGLHLRNVYCEIGAGAKLENFCLHLGSDMVRTDLNAKLVGGNGQFTFGGAYVGEAANHSDMTTVIEHVVPDCVSREVVRGVLAGRSKGVFQGKIVVHKDAQKTDGYQMSKALLLSDKADLSSKPELEIFADDVKCSHGSTAGELDEDAIFYLRSRGIPLGEAKALLVEGFLDDAVDEISDEQLKDPLKAVISDWLSRHARSIEAEDQ